MSSYSIFKVSLGFLWLSSDGLEKETIKKWMVSGSIKKAYDRSVKGYVYITDQNSKLQLPQDTRRQELYLIQPFLNL